MNASENDNKNIRTNTSSKEHADESLRTERADAAVYTEKNVGASTDLGIQKAPEKTEDAVEVARIKTDESLLTERVKTDRALREKKKEGEAKTDMVLQKARENKEDVLEMSRKMTDEQSHSATSEPNTVTDVEKKRAKVDEVVGRERQAADALLKRQREDEAASLKRLFALEREKTDRTLLTERIRADNALENRDDFLGMVSHDLRDLLSGILFSATLLTQQATSSNEGNRMRTVGANIERYVARMNRLIGDLVDVSSIDAGKLSMSIGEVDTTSLIKEAVDVFSALSAEKNISLGSEFSGESLVVAGDHDRLLQVFANLISNALKFSPQGGSIVIGRKVAGNAVEFCVADTGSGMKKDVLEVIFDRFWQVEKNNRRGLGLGLYITKCIVLAHGGKIWAESTPGQGSRFFFTIPLVSSYANN